MSSWDIICLLFLKLEFVEISSKLKSWVFLGNTEHEIFSYNIEITSEQPYFNSFIGLEDTTILFICDLCAYNLGCINIKMKIRILLSLHKSDWRSANTGEILLCVNTFQCDFNDLFHQTYKTDIVPIWQTLEWRNLKKFDEFPRTLFDLIFCFKSSAIPTFHSFFSKNIGYVKAEVFAKCFLICYHPWSCLAWLLPSRTQGCV